MKLIGAQFGVGKIGVGSFRQPAGSYAHREGRITRMARQPTTTVPYYFP
jgi:hypothetical protein